jgi:glycosyltransferase involved in cell wall biosynthesis
MRIAVVHNLPAGGARRRLSNQLEHLHGDIIELCLESALPILPDAVVVPVRRTAPRAHRLVRPPFRYLDLAWVEAAWRHLAVSIRSFEPDVIYLNACQYLKAPPVLDATSPPAVYFCDEPRDTDEDPAIRATRNPLTMSLYAPLRKRERRIDSRTVALSRRLATNSHYGASEIARAYGRAATVITPGVAVAFRQTDSEPSGQQLLLSVGTLSPSKGHDLVLQTAAAASSRLPVHVVAPRPEPREEARLRDLAETLGIELNIRVGISDGDLARLYESALVTLYLASKEPFGLVSLEAQACGCPVIVSAEGGLPETILDGVTGWQVPRDPDTAAKMVDRLADGGLRREMSCAARAHASGYTWEASARELASLLDEVSERWTAGRASSL